MSDIFSFDQRIQELENRVAKLEGKPTAVKPRHDDGLVPKGWLYVAQFSDRYKFISSTRLCKLLNENKEFFNGKTLRIGGRVYMDPVDVAMFFESDLINSCRLEKQYSNWKSVSPDLMNLINKAKERMGLRQHKQEVLF